ncbi:MAG: flavin reductase family protein [Deltaproteobacteria bacterium]|nr:MAG: flavin reductase family protein [Deltaproteobacteria bacterium]
MGLKEISWDQALEWASPFPYVLVVSLDQGGRPNAMGVGWWSIVSWEPRLLAISVAPERYTYECLKARGEFTLCFPSKDLKEAAWLCGTRSGRKVDKFALGKLKGIPSRFVRPPLLEGSTVAFECRIKEEMEAGDHVLFLAEILATYGDEGRLLHLYSIHYRKLVAIDCKGTYKFDL